MSMVLHAGGRSPIADTLLCVYRAAYLLLPDHTFRYESDSPRPICGVESDWGTTAAFGGGIAYFNVHLHFLVAAQGKRTLHFGIRGGQERVINNRRYHV
jgi:hypothetical protein